MDDSVAGRLGVRGPTLEDLEEDAEEEGKGGTTVPDRVAGPNLRLFY